LIEESNLSKKIARIVEILKATSNSELVEMGIRGLAEVKLNYSKDAVVKKYINLVNSLMI
jgi:hypothetical protein